MHVTAIGWFFCVIGTYFLFPLVKCLHASICEENEFIFSCELLPQKTSRDLFVFVVYVFYNSEIFHELPWRKSLTLLPNGSDVKILRGFHPPFQLVQQ
jgi:hypothetical protein